MNLSARFWAKVIPEPMSGCYLWIGALNGRGGYGEMKIAGKVLKAHRVSWYLATGAWPHLGVLHKCDVPACVRLEHLFEGTQKDNMQDCARKGRNIGPSLTPRGESAWNAVLTVALVREIRACVAAGEAQRAVARRLGIARDTLRHVVRGDTWTHVLSDDL